MLVCRWLMPMNRLKTISGNYRLKEKVPPVSAIKFKIEIMDIKTQKMKELLEIPDIAAEIKKQKALQEKAQLIGNEIRKNLPVISEAAKKLSTNSMITALIATCTSEEEIKEVLTAAGIRYNSVYVVTVPCSDGWMYALTVCRMLPLIFSKEGLPVIIRLADNANARKE